MYPKASVLKISVEPLIVGIIHASHSQSVSSTALKWLRAS